MRVFIAVVDAQGFTAASRSLAMSLPTVCRKIGELEDLLGAQLLNRSSRKIIPTDSGAQYYDDAKRILEEVDAAAQRASGEFRYAKGLLSITAPALFGQLLILPIVHDFMQHHEEIQFRLLFTNHVIDLSAEHIDLGIRIGSLTDNSMVVKQVGSLRQIVCATSDYLSDSGIPISPLDILKHRSVTFSRSGDQVRWSFQSSSGQQQLIAVKSRLVLNTAESALQAALLGGGLVQLYSYQASDHIVAGDLQIVLAQYEIDPVPVNFLFPGKQRLPQKTQAFVDFALPAITRKLEQMQEHWQH